MSIRVEIERKKIDYPCLMQSKKDQTIVWAIDDSTNKDCFKGLVLNPCPSSMIEIIALQDEKGLIECRRNAFIFYKGKVTLSNEIDEDEIDD